MTEPPISLEQYAGISAALAEELPLAEVLAQEQVEELAFRQAEPMWRERIAESVAVQLAYTEKFAIAQDCLARKISPIEDDPEAWVGLLNELATSDGQSAFLAKLGITMNDIGRVGRTWKRRTQRDMVLAKKMAELAATAKAPAAVSVGPLELKPFPWTPEKRARDPELGASAADHPIPSRPAPVVKQARASFQMSEASPMQPSVVDEPSAASWTLERYAALAIGLRANPADAEAIMQQAGLVTPASRQTLHEHFRRRFDQEPGVRAQFDSLLAGPRPVAQASRPRTAAFDVSSLQRSVSPVPFPMEAPSSSRRRDQRAADELLAKHGPEDAAVVARMKAARKDASPAATAEVDNTKLSRPLPFFEQRGEAASSPDEPKPRSQSGLTVDAGAPLGWTVDRYARLCADLRACNSGEAQVLAAARLSREARELLDAYWQRRLNAEPALYSEWLRHANERITELRGR